MKKILITGITGFLGSHIGEELIKQNYSVMALKRGKSNMWRCNGYYDKIKWINIDNPVDAESEIIEFGPEILVHAAWNGVKASDRDNWSEQLVNLYFLISMLELSGKAGVKKIIALGTQAEYGKFEGLVNEIYPCNPNSAYGTTKLCASTLLKAYCEQNNLDWYWLRIFSVFGPREEKNWIIPAVINNLLDRKEMALTPCEQKYDYLYAKDFVTGIMNLIKCNESKSGVYNLASGKSIRLKDILEFLEQKLSPERKYLMLGALEYRPGQVMDMRGNSDQFYKFFSFRPSFNIYDGLEETMNYYINERNNEEI